MSYYFDTKSIKGWIYFAISSAVFSLAGVVVSGYLGTLMQDGYSELLKSERSYSVVVFLLILNGHLIGDRLLVTKKITDEIGNVRNVTSGFIIVLWVIISATLSRLFSKSLVNYELLLEVYVSQSLIIALCCLMGLVLLIVLALSDRSRRSGQAPPHSSGDDAVE